MEDDTRQRLLDAAEALFAEHGFADTSLRAITARARADVQVRKTRRPVPLTAELNP